MPTTPAPEKNDIAWKSINSIRALSMDAVEQANSGHPGTPMALAPAAYVLWTNHLRYNPRGPDWADRDRFVLSCGHSSMLLYGLLHLSGYDLPLAEIKAFRQWGSATPGHPERGATPGVEVTTGPLGQGVGNAVGMAMAERLLAGRFNRPDFPIVDHRVWAFVSDGDLMEGVASEVASLAGHLRLAKLTLIYDDNRITIDGETSLAFSEDVGARFRAYGWHVVEVADGNDLGAIDAALTAARHGIRVPRGLRIRHRQRRQPPARFHHVHHCRHGRRLAGLRHPRSAQREARSAGGRPTPARPRHPRLRATRSHRAALPRPRPSRWA